MIRPTRWLARLLALGVAGLAACADGPPPAPPPPPQPAAAAPAPSARARPVASTAAPPAPTHPPAPTCPSWAPVSGGEFTPASLANLGFWFDTDPSTQVKDERGKTVWRDRTQHFDATWGYGYCARGPAYVPHRDGRGGELRYHESGCLTVMDRCGSLTSFDLGAADFALFVVASPAVEGVFLTAFNQVPLESSNFVRTVSLAWDPNGVHVAGAAKLDAKGKWSMWHVYGIERHGDRVSLSVDGVVKASAKAKPAPTTAANFFLGLDDLKERDNVGNPYWLGFMGDVIGVKGALAAAQRARIVAYLKKKYAPLIR